MINDRIIQIQAFRLHLVNFCFCSPSCWDRKNKRMKPSPLPVLWNWWLVTAGASVYTLSVLHRLYQNGQIVFSESTPPEEKLYLVSPSGKRVFANFIYLVIDALACVFIVMALGIAWVLARRGELSASVQNAVIETNEHLFEILEDQTGSRPTEQSKSGKQTERNLHMLNVGTLVLPVMYGLLILHPYEPVHRSLEEWLEIKPGINLSFLPIMIMVDWGLIFCGNVILLPISMAIMYIELCQFWILGITPSHITNVNGQVRYDTALGSLSGPNLMTIYRCLQNVSVVVNENLKSGWVSMHHAGILMMFVLSAFLCIQYTDEVREMGSPGVIIVAALIVPILVEYHETHLLGRILSQSREFIRIGRRINGSPLIRRFFRSCTDIQLKTGYPFFVISFDTFLLILHQGIDFLVSMLVFAG